MRHLQHLTDARLEAGSVLSIGVFDGVHRGHQALARELVQRARQTGRKAVVVTFFPHPDKVLRATEERYYLCPPDERAELLLGLGIDLVITHPFDEATRQLRAVDFVSLLLKHLRLRELRVGAEFALGFQREGDIAFLRAQGQERDFQVVTIAPVTAQGERIRSADLRALLRTGDMRGVTARLGRNYTVAGEVVMGEQRGRTIGFPTANLDVWREQILPAHGVYAAWAHVDGTRYRAATNIGTRPTFAGASPTIETHLLDFHGDLYGKRLRLAFVERLRAEKKFASLDELTTQIHADTKAARACLADKPAV
ncbi:MAG: bifunctional riboflavin kinase/FAD synthetase [Chloroflexi bacterium]|nr:bifunctional riboflavin kinase/FAD synthetase [Chloroflexota bacterium]MCY3582053.1 bifunctional riboflavin kinase/FAD synthetase [Chloroflexota bacterium]MCY3715330.1 bifunctional riboflavin kinase/FAD synthetase [Chloroflexota bacterium]MDE2649539.1 bifunctional riboflavin kinase/FAD synthetase [Chloroflexota bacterium]MXX52324.1 bifunctional riboflavin kinase/FAD synthetase [Chloroflexota bacterium]